MISKFVDNLWYKNPHRSSSFHKFHWVEKNVTALESCFHVRTVGITTNRFLGLILCGSFRKKKSRGKLFDSCESFNDVWNPLVYHQQFPVVVELYFLRQCDGPSSDDTFSQSTKNHMTCWRSGLDRTGIPKFFNDVSMNSMETEIMATP